MIVSKKSIFIIILLLCVQGLTSASAGVPSGVEVSLTSIQSEFSADEAITLEFSYQNTTDLDISMLKWGTAFESRLSEDLLAIVYQGEELAYSGWHIKRAPAVDSDYVVLKANSITRREVNLLMAYSIDFKGSYDIKLRETGQRAEKSQSSIVLKLTSDRLIAFKRTPTVASCPDGVSGLPNNRFSLTDQAVSSAESIARTARDSLRSTPTAERPNAKRYREWFGPYNISRWNTVQSNFDLIYAAVRDQTLVFTCEDDESFFAAVNRFTPYRIFLGRAFWSAPRTGTDSKSGTIIHELSHFNILGGTDDNVYGQRGARALAISNPNSAANNADSHEYFAENTPFLSMFKPADLVIASSSISNANPSAGRSVFVTGVIANDGDGIASPTSLTLTLMGASNSPQKFVIAIPSIDNGSNFTFRLGFQAPAQIGEYTTKLCVSALVGESNTANNCSALPALVVKESLTITPIFQLLLDDEPI